MSACKLRHGVPQSEVRFAGIANGSCCQYQAVTAGLVPLYFGDYLRYRRHRTYGTVGTVGTCWYRR